MIIVQIFFSIIAITLMIYAKMKNPTAVYYAFLVLNIANTIRLYSHNIELDGLSNKEIVQ